MKKIIILTLLSLMSYCFTTMAQDTRTLQVIVLNNGYTLSGYVETRPDGSYKVETLDGDILYYAPSDIESIKKLKKGELRLSSTKKPQKDKLSLSSNNTSQSFEKETGYIGIVSTHIGFPFLGIQMVNGYQITKWFSAGVLVGFGLDPWTAPYYYCCFPLQLDFRFTLGNNKRFYIAMNSGVDVGADAFFSSSLEGGIRFPVMDNRHYFWLGLYGGGSEFYGGMGGVRFSFSF